MTATMNEDKMQRTSDFCRVSDLRYDVERLRDALRDDTESTQILTSLSLLCRKIKHSHTKSKDQLMKYVNWKMEIKLLNVMKENKVDDEWDGE